MEDNHAINEQLNSAVNYEEEYKKVVALNNNYQDTIKRLVARIQQLEDNWMLHRANFLFKIVENNKFDPDIRQQAQKEIEEFLFPSKEEIENDSKDKEA